MAAKKQSAKDTAAKKKRKSEGVKPKQESAEGEAPKYGNVSFIVQTQLTLTEGLHNDVVIEWRCLGLAEEPDSITDASGNHNLFDKDRPMTTDEDGLHMYFDPPLAGPSVYGFQLVVSYNEAVEAKTTPKDEDEKERQREREHQEAAA